MSRDNKLAYAAGYFDGEGSITMCSGRLRVQVASGDYWSVHLFSELFGGTVSQQRERPGTYTKGLRMFRWIMSGDSVFAILYELRPYLLAKQNEADVILEARSAWRTFRSGHLSDDQKQLRKAIHAKLKSLKGPGRQFSYPKNVRIEQTRYAEVRTRTD